MKLAVAIINPETNEVLSSRDIGDVELVKSLLNVDGSGAGQQAPTDPRLPVSHAAWLPADHQHRIPKAGREVKPRISLTFRKLK